jgi:hypothetical protein
MEAGTAVLFGQAASLTALLPGSISLLNQFMNLETTYVGQLVRALPSQRRVSYSVALETRGTSRVFGPSLGTLFDELYKGSADMAKNLKRRLLWEPYLRHCVAKKGRRNLKDCASINGKRSGSQPNCAGLCGVCAIWFVLMQKN